MGAHCVEIGNDLQNSPGLLSLRRVAVWSLRGGGRRWRSAGLRIRRAVWWPGLQAGYEGAAGRAVVCRQHDTWRIRGRYLSRNSGSESCGQQGHKQRSGHAGSIRARSIWLQVLDKTGNRIRQQAPDQARVTSRLPENSMECRPVDISRVVFECQCANFRLRREPHFHEQTTQAVYSSKGSAQTSARLRR